MPHLLLGRKHLYFFILRSSARSKERRRHVCCEEGCICIASSCDISHDLDSRKETSCLFLERKEALEGGSCILLQDLEAREATLLLTTAIASLAGNPNMNSKPTGKSIRSRMQNINCNSIQGMKIKWRIIKERCRKEIYLITKKDEAD